MKTRFAVLLALLVASSAACQDKARERPKGLGVAVADGPSREVTPAPDGSSLAWIAEPRPAKEVGVRNVADNIWVGTARFAPAGGGAPVGLGRGVATLPGSLLFSPSSQQVAALSEFRFTEQLGTLVVGDVAKGEARTVAENVSFFAFSRDGKRLGWVSAEACFVAPADGSLPAVALATQVSTFDFSPDGSKLLLRRKLVSDGALLLQELPAPGATPAPARRLGAAIADYNWSPAGDRIAWTARSLDGGYDLFLAAGDAAPVKLGGGVPGFTFSPDGKTLAFQGGVTPAKQFGDLFLLPAGAKAPVKLAESVTEVRFSADSSHLAWLERYDPGSRGGTLAYAKVEPEPVAKKLGPNVPSFLWSRTGRYLAYLQRTLSPVFSVDLFLEKLDAQGAPTKVAQGVFGYDFGNADELLYYRTACTRSGRSCDLAVVPAARPTEPARKIAPGVFTFEFDPADQRVLMLTYARMDADALDIAVVPADGSSPPKTLDILVAPGTKWLGRDGARVTYALLDRKRQGVYVAEVAPALAQAAAAPAPAPAR